MPLIIYKYCNCKGFVVCLSLILFPKITIAEAANEMYLSMVASARDMFYAFP